ncbi:hypothetical protein ASD93_13535 [Microbacterium sp. Root180]|nr:hypothetical protein ASD93_13535 [Microbacterium sp. Root180]
MNEIQRTIAAAAVAASIACLGACSATQTVHMEGSRVELYDSVKGIVADSSVVAVVDVHHQEVVKDDIEYTLSTATIIEKFSPAGLGVEVPADTPHLAGETVVVRQMGVEGMELPYAILRSGEKYLLFLSPTVLKKDGLAQYYITGGSAGLYSVDGDRFVHGPFEEGDQLPNALTAADLKG